MAVNMYKHVAKVVVKNLQGSAVTQTALGGLTIPSGQKKRYPVLILQ